MNAVGPETPAHSETAASVDVSPNDRSVARVTVNGSSAADTPAASRSALLAPSSAHDDCESAGSTGGSEGVDDGRRLERRAGGVPALPVTVLFIVAVALIVTLTSIVVLSTTAASAARDELLRELGLAANAMIDRVVLFLDAAARAPVVAARALQAPGFDPRNASQALPLLARVLHTCAACSCAYFGLNTPDDHYYVLCNAPPPAYLAYSVTLTLSNGTAVPAREERYVSNLTAPSPAIGGVLRHRNAYVPRRRPWWPTLVGADPDAGAYVPLYLDFTTGLAATTAGAATLTSGGQLYGVLAADLGFAPLVERLREALGAERGGLLFEAPTGNVLFTSWADEGVAAATAGLVTIEDLRDSRARRVLSWFSAEELMGNEVVTHERFGTTLGESLAARLVPVVVGGLELRVLVFADGRRTRESLSRGVGIAAGASLAGCALVTALAVALAVRGLQRPLAGMAAHVNGRAMAALTGEESEDDSDDGCDASASPTGQQHRSPRAEAEARRQKEDALPALHELRVIRLAFDELVAELRRVRSYIPDGAFLGGPHGSRRHSLAVASESLHLSRPPSPSWLAKDACGIPEVDQDAATDLSSLHSSRGQTPIRVEAATPQPFAAPSVTPPRHLSPIDGGSLSYSHNLSRRGSPSPQHALAAMRTATVTLAALEVPGLSKAAAALGPIAASVLVELVAEIVEAAAAAYLGAVEHFAGDRVVLSFNTLRASHSHRRLAVECCLAVHKAVRAIRGEAESGRGAPTLRRADAGTLPVRRRVCIDAPAAAVRLGTDERPPTLPGGITAGVAAGKAVIGAAGSAGLTRFCVLAECRAQAERNLRACDLASRQAPSETSVVMPLTLAAAPVVTDGTFMGELAHSVAYQAIDLVPGTGHGRSAVSRLRIAAMRFLLDYPGRDEAAAHGAKREGDGNDGEWMYELQRAEAANEFADINAAFVAFAAGNETEARANLLKAQERPDAAAAAAGIARLQQLLDPHE